MNEFPITNLLYLLVWVVAIFSVELLLRFAVKLRFIKNVWYMHLLFRIVAGGSVIYILWFQGAVIG